MEGQQIEPGVCARFPIPLFWGGERPALGSRGRGSSGRLEPRSRPPGKREGARRGGDAPPRHK